MSIKQAVKAAVSRDLRVFSKKPPFFRRPERIFKRRDKIDVVFFILFILFVIAVLLPAPLEAEQIIASKFQWIALIACISAFGRRFFDTVPVEHNDILQEGRTKTVYESKDPHGLYITAICFVIAFGIHALLYFFILQLFPLSFFEFNTQMLTMTVTVAFSEELLFSYCLTGLLAPRIGWFVVPGITCIFVIFHLYVYAGCVAALVYVLIMRATYSFVYLLSRRISSVMLAHMLNNFLVGLRVF